MDLYDQIVSITSKVILDWPKSSATLHKISSFATVAELFGQPDRFQTILYEKFLSCV